MSSIIQQNLDRIESVIPAPNSLSASKKRWHSAFVSIYCSRALLSLVKDSPPAKKKAKISPSPSFVILDLQEEMRFKVDQATLTNIVTQKKPESLQNIGGVDGVASALQTNVECGIHGDVDDIARRNETFGSNTYKRPPTKSFFHFVWEEFRDLTILFNLGCTLFVVPFDIKKYGTRRVWYYVGSLLVASFLVVAIRAIIKFKQSIQFDKLFEVNNNIQIDVVRAGRRQQISIFEIVVGDVICLKIGDQVPADGLFLDGQSLQLDESSMTEESDHVEVNCNHPFLFSGTKVVDGYARMLVTSVAVNTTWGKMMSSISRDTNEQTPLQAQLNKLTSSIGKAGLAAAFLVLIVLLVRFFTRNLDDENGNKEFNGSMTKFNDMVHAILKIVATTANIVEVAIPEGLPLAVTISVAYSIKKMTADQATVRKLSAYETMGFATTICTNMIGTLTLNQMKVTKFWLGKIPFAQAAYSSISPNIIELVQEGVALNTTSSIYQPTSGSEIEYSGSPTEKAILSWAVLVLNMEMEKLTQSCKILHVEIFNSQKKRSGVLMKRMVDKTIHVHWKGAAEMILKMCSSYYDASGSIQNLDDGEKKNFEQIIRGMAASSLRCIAFAHKQVLEEDQEHKKIEDDGLTLLGLVGIKDPYVQG
jgi:Ca2+-transporting ATPase